MTSGTRPEDGRTIAVGGGRTVPAPDGVARDYLLLALRLDQHQPGLVDGYYGPADLKAQTDLEGLRRPAALADDAAALRERVVGEVSDPDRARWLERQLLALETIARRLAGESWGYRDEVQRCFDAPPEALADAVYGEVHAELERSLPGSGSLRERVEAWDARFTIPVDRLRAVVEALLPPLRAATAAVLPIPAGETLQVSLVSRQPWRGYDWYEGGLHSRIDLNTDLPMPVADLIETLSHEAFPGHHLEHAWKERRLVEEQGRLEASILLIDTPECYVSEGLAELGRRYTLGADASIELLLLACRAAGLAAGRADAERQIAIGAARHRLRGAGGDAALLLHEAGRSPEEVAAWLAEHELTTLARARQRLEFLQHPLWRTYVFSYAGGESLLAAWCELEGPERAPTRFLRLLTEQLTPSALAAEVAASRS